MSESSPAEDDERLGCGAAIKRNGGQLQRLDSRFCAASGDILICIALAGVYALRLLKWARFGHSSCPSILALAVTILYMPHVCLVAPIYGGGGGDYPVAGKNNRKISGGKSVSRTFEHECYDRLRPASPTRWRNVSPSNAQLTITKHTRYHEFSQAVGLVALIACTYLYV